MKSALTIKLEAALESADNTVKQSKLFIGAAPLRTAAMATHYLISEALTISTAADNTPAPQPPTPQPAT